MPIRSAAASCGRYLALFAINTEWQVCIDMRCSSVHSHRSRAHEELQGIQVGPAPER